MAWMLCIDSSLHKFRPQGLYIYGFQDLVIQNLKEAAMGKNSKDFIRMRNHCMFQWISQDLLCSSNGRSKWAYAMIDNS